MAIDMFMPGLRMPQGMCLHAVVIGCIALLMGVVVISIPSQLF